MFGDAAAGELINHMLDRRVDGLIVETSPTGTAHTAAMVARSGVPTVLITGSHHPTDIDQVDTDTGASARSIISRPCTTTAALP